MSATTSVFVLTEQPPYLGNIKKDGAAEQIRLFLMARKRWARRQAKGTALPTLSQLMEESDVNSLCTISLARFKREDKLTFAIEYQEAQAGEEESEERFWISDEEDDESSVRDYEDDDVGALLQIENFLRRRDETQLIFCACLEKHQL